MPAGTTRILYVADPMCSWCWGFAPILASIESDLAPGVEVQLVLGGLAPDDDAPMPEPTRRYVRSAWKAVEARTGVSFDHSFWERCIPRRSTYPACRAVIASGARDREMFAAIQRAYYTQARNPSEPETLLEIAGELGLDTQRFRIDIESPETEARLAQHFELRDRLFVTGFPCLAFERSGEMGMLTRGWVDERTTRDILSGAQLLV